MKEREKMEVSEMREMYCERYMRHELKKAKSM